MMQRALSYDDTDDHMARVRKGETRVAFGSEVGDVIVSPTSVLD